MQFNWFLISRFYLEKRSVKLQFNTRRYIFWNTKIFSWSLGSIDADSFADVGSCTDVRARERNLFCFFLFAGIFFSVASVRDHIRVGRTLLPESIANQPAGQPARLLSSIEPFAYIRHDCYDWRSSKIRGYISLLPAQCLRHRDKVSSE